MTKPYADPKHVAEAICKVADANHYLVWLNAEAINDEALLGAEQILISTENTGKLLNADLCFDIINTEKRARKL